MALNDDSTQFDMIYKLDDVVWVLDCATKTRSNIDNRTYADGSRFKAFAVKRIDIVIQKGEVIHLIGDTDRYMATNQANMYRVEDCYLTKDDLIASLGA